MLVVVVSLLLSPRMTSAFAVVAAAGSSPVPPPPPLSVPVWSLACRTIALQQKKGVAADVSQKQRLPATSMNIVTFCTAVSVAAPKLWVVSLYYDTLTKDAFLASGAGVLQLLRPAHKMLVPVLGKRSGYEAGYSKRSESAALGFEWVHHQPFATNQLSANHNDDDRERQQGAELLPDCATYIHLKLINTFPAGDHLVALCEVVHTGTWDDTNRKIVSADDAVVPALLDTSTVLYTGQLRHEKIL